MADHLNYTFVDFDHAVNARMNTTIAALKRACVTEYQYRQTVKPILEEILDEYREDLILAMPPSGLFHPYKKVFDRQADVVSVWLSDKAENIFDRLMFTDDDDNLIEEDVITPDNERHYREVVKNDIAYYYDTLRKARVKFDIKGRDANQTALALIELLLGTDQTI